MDLVVGIDPTLVVHTLAVDERSIGRLQILDPPPSVTLNQPGMTTRHQQFHARVEPHVTLGRSAKHHLGPVDRQLNPRQASRRKT